MSLTFSSVVFLPSFTCTPNRFYQVTINHWKGRAPVFSARLDIPVILLTLRSVRRVPSVY